MRSTVRRERDIRTGKRRAQMQVAHRQPIQINPDIRRTYAATARGLARSRRPHDVKPIRRESGDVEVPVPERTGRPAQLETLAFEPNPLRIREAERSELDVRWKMSAKTGHVNLRAKPLIDLRRHKISPWCGIQGDEHTARGGHGKQQNRACGNCQKFQRANQKASPRPI